MKVKQILIVVYCKRSTEVALAQEVDKHYSRTRCDVLAEPTPAECSLEVCLLHVLIVVRISTEVGLETLPEEGHCLS